MRYCLTCNRAYTDTKQRFCTVDGARLSLKDPFKLVGSILVDRYRLDALVGIGGFGAVYSAHHLRIDRQVAVKILLPHFSVSNNEICELFEREAKVAGRLSHENIADVKDAGRTPEGLAYMVMEWLEGCTLEEEIAANGRLSFTRTAEILRQVAAALDEAHNARIIHRDLKPANIMVIKRPNGQDRIKVLDFGIAKIVSSTAGSPVSIAIGTPHYASPEQVREGGTIDTRSDIYSLGVMLYQMLSGALPFNASSLQELIRQQLMASPSPLRTLRPEAPLIIEQLLDAMLEKEAADRPEWAGEVSRRFDLGVQVEQLLREGRGAFQDRDYRVAISKLEEALRLSPDEPDVRNVIRAVQAAQEEIERRARIDQWPREAPQTFDAGGYGQAVRKPEEGLPIPAAEPGGRPNAQPAPAAQQSINDAAEPSRGRQDSGFTKDRQPSRNLLRRPLSIAAIVVAVIATVIGAIWLTRSNKDESVPTGTQAPEQGRSGASTNSQPTPAPVATTNVEAMTYYLEIEEDKGKTTRASGVDPYKPGQKFKLHFTPRERGYLYIIAPGTMLDPTTYLTARPIASTGVRTNKVAAGGDFVFPGADNWLRVRSDVDTMRVTVIFSPEPLQTPDYLASAAGQKLTTEEYSQLERLGLGIEPEPSGDHAIVKVAVRAGEARQPLRFEIRIKRR